MKLKQKILAVLVVITATGSIAFASLNPALATDIEVRSSIENTMIDIAVVKLERTIAVKPKLSILQKRSFRFSCNP